MRISTLAREINTMTETENNSKLDNIKVLEYIKFLASSSGTDISSWNITKIFGNNNETVDLEKNRSEINKRFYEFCKNLRESPTNKELEPELKKELERNFSEYINGSIKAEIETLKNTIASDITNIRHYEESIRQTLVSIEKRSLKLSNHRVAILNNLEPLSCVEKFKNILNEDRWENLVLKKADCYFSLYLNTKNNIVINYQSKQAGIDIKLDVGKLAVRINFPLTQHESKSIAVIPYDKNIAFEEFYHPHIGKAGQICWGNATDLITKAMSERDYEAILNILYSLLHSYNPGNPYVDIVKLKELGTRYKTKKIYLLHPDNEAKPKAINTEANNCEIF